MPTEKKSKKWTDRSCRRKTYWKGTQLIREDHPITNSSKAVPELRTLPVAPFKVLDAPNLRDDYYCSILAFDAVSQTLAVGLGTRLYSWAESTGVQALEDNGLGEISWLTTLDFSSVEGKKCILAYGRSNGILNLMSLWDAPSLYDRQYPRFRFIPHVEEAPVACVSWKPTVTMRPSVNPYNPGPLVGNEDLLVGDEQGNVFYYAVEWPFAWETYRHNWRGSVQCLACITSHSQQICGLSWAPSGNLFATGGNDNLCFLFETEKVTRPRQETERDEAIDRLFTAFREPIPPQAIDLRHSSGDPPRVDRLTSHTRSPPPTDVVSSTSRQEFASAIASSVPTSSMDSIDDRLSSVPVSPFARFLHPYSNTRFWDLNRMVGERAERRHSPALPETVNAASNSFRSPISSTSGEPLAIDHRHAKHKWEHTAAVKAIAFCPWREGLLATGGGSHDKCIHFYHTTSGVALATIAVHAQVTSLIWSTTRREIAATFGYAQPDHPYRIAVFSWPECRQVAAIPWDGEHRALYAIPYPQGPPDYRAARNATGRARDRDQERREKEKRRNRTAAEGCIVVAASDKSIKFHEVWSGGKKATVGGSGLLGGSDILEDLEGIEKEGDIIR
ncbi:hypothetical protein N0V82_001124 [Gnomoniopsis sp. IMI 355080]|nr:hypothetical protein N0V82_001124 [Gnomoniopsis sp. IMI 355080]